MESQAIQGLDTEDEAVRVIQAAYDSGLPFYTKDAIRQCSTIFNAFRLGASEANVVLRHIGGLSSVELVTKPPPFTDPDNPDVESVS